MIKTYHAIIGHTCYDDKQKVCCKLSVISITTAIKTYPTAALEADIYNFHNWSLQPSSQDYWLNFSHISAGTYSLKSTSNDRFFEKLFMAIFIYSQRFCVKSPIKLNVISVHMYAIIISNTYIANVYTEQKGPNIDPWGIPLKTFSEFEMLPFR